MRSHLIRTALNGLLFSAALVSANNINPEETYKAMCEACTDAAKRDNDTVAAVIYASKTTIVYKYGQCIPYVLNNNDRLQGAYFCRAAMCSQSATTQCTGLKVPRDPFYAGANFLNVEDLGRSAMNSAKCYYDATMAPIQNTTLLPVCKFATATRDL